MRELIAYRAYGLGVLMSRFPADAPDVAGLPYGLQEYYARYPSLNDTAADLLFLAMPITTVRRFDHDRVSSPDLAAGVP